MKRENLRSLGLSKETVNQIMMWNGFDIEAEKKKYREMEKIYNQLKAKLTAEKEAQNIRAEQSVWEGILKEAVKSTEYRDKKIFLALL